tara:strand:- start:403 stop:1824 length:1422 start_codon:yes stop_codon:yes gene_type:complete
MNPPTLGHRKLADKVKSLEGTPFLFLTHSQKPKTDPLSFAEKVFFAQKSFGDGIRIGDQDVKTIIQALQKLESLGFKNVVYVAGSDRVNSFTKLLNDYNGKDYNFDNIQIVSAGERDPDAEGAEGMSASKMRSAAQEGNYDEFESGVAVKDPKLAKMMYTKVRQGMGLDEANDTMGGGTDFSKFMGYKPGDAKNPNRLLPKIVQPNLGTQSKPIKVPKIDGKDYYYENRSSKNPFVITTVEDFQRTDEAIWFYPLLAIGGRLGFKYGAKSLKYIGRWMKGNPGKTFGGFTLPWTGPILARIVEFIMKAFGFLSRFGIPIAIGVIAVYGGKKLYDALKDKDPKEMTEKELKNILSKYAPRSDDDLKPLLKKQPKEDTNIDEYEVKQQKPKIDVLNNIASRKDNTAFPLSWNSGKGEISVGGKMYVDPNTANKFVKFFDNNKDKQDAMVQALRSATTTAKLFDVLGLPYNLRMEK